MATSSERTFTGDFKRGFLRGLVVLLPSVLTLWIVVKGYQFVNTAIAEPINQSVRIGIIEGGRVWTPIRTRFDPTTEAIDLEITNLMAQGEEIPPREQIRARLRAEKVRAWWDDHWWTNFIGFVVAILGVYIAGRLVGGFIGRRVYRRLEELITALPVFKHVYPHIKQIVDFLFGGDKQIQFSRVVVCEYPRKGIWSVGFLTGDTLRSVQDHAGESVTIFIPSSPTPFTGYTITVPRSEVIELPLTVEEAIRFAVSGGVLIPDHQKVRRAGDGASIDDSGLIPIPGSEPTTEDQAATEQSRRDAS
ncbi:MAG: DUF502 domain-containing protein [Planctomycetota bacterium]